MSVLISFPGGSDGKESACNTGDPCLIPGSGRSSGEGNGNPLQYSCLENFMDRGAWQATVHGVTKSWTQLSDCHSHHTLKWDWALFICLLTFVLLWNVCSSFAHFSIGWTVFFVYSGYKSFVECIVRIYLAKSSSFLFLNCDICLYIEHQFQSSCIISFYSSIS